MKCFVLIGVAIFVLISADKCEMESAYPPPSNTTIGFKIINLDLPAENRWTEIVKPLSSEIEALVTVITRLVPPKILKVILASCDKGIDAEFLNRFPNSYGDEIRGISKDTGVDACALVIYNIAYEVLGGCTSIVAESPDGKIYHGRNLDFGLGPFNISEMQWQLTDALRPLLVNLHFQKGGKTLYSTTQYAGYVGLLTGFKKGGFSITVNSRFDNNYDHYLAQWLKDKTDTANFLSFLTRTTMEKASDFKSALNILTHSNMVGPSYIIIGGVASGEGAIVTNDPNTTVARDVKKLGEGNSTFFVLQTNYDNWVTPPFFDNRREPADDCMKRVGTKNVDIESLYNVLHAHPNRNRLTTYTTLFDVAEGHMEASVQYCEEKGCVPW